MSDNDRLRAAIHDLVRTRCELRDGTPAIWFAVTEGWLS